MKKNALSRRRFLRSAGAFVSLPIAFNAVNTASYSLWAGTARSYDFSGSISREVLESYLSRSITEMALLYDDAELDENIRFLKNIGAKFIGRALCCWADEPWIFENADAARRRVERVWAADEDMILQACVFETITKKVERVPIPAFVFEAFDLPVEERCFRYNAMVSDWGRDHWAADESVPDIERLETQLWFYTAAAANIDAGCEALHFGQVDFMSQNRPKLWDDLLAKVRAYAAEHARRRYVLCDGHVPSCGLVVEGRLLLDFHSFPLRIKEVESSPRDGVLEMNYLDTIYGKSRGGVTPSGWSCEHLPYLVEIDNFGSMPPSKRGTATPESCFVWGFDEIDWFANQPEAYRNRWLAYANDWVRTHDPAGYFQMPGRRCLADPDPGLDSTYRANTRSQAAPDGFNQEETIKKIWASAGSV